MNKQAILGVFDQGIQSLINFLIGLFLIRFASKEEYGIYGIGFALTQLCVGLANAFVITQMTVNMHNKPNKEREAYCSSMFMALLVFCIIVSGFIISASYIPFFSYYESLIHVLAVTAPCYIIIEFLRRYFYLRQKPIYAFVSNLCLLIIFISILFYFYLNKTGNLHLNIFFAYAISALFISTVIVFIFIRFPFIKVITIVKSSIDEALSNGFWACGGVLVTALQSQGWVYLIATLKGTESIADANAARLFLSPISIMSTGFNRVFMPKIAQLNSEESTKTAILFARKVLLLLLIMIFVYSVILFFMLDWLISLFMTKEYQSLEALVILWVVYYISQSIRSVASQLLQVLRYFKVITLANAITAFIWFGASIWVVNQYDIHGAVSSMIIAEIVLAVILWWKVSYAKKTS